MERADSPKVFDNYEARGGVDDLVSLVYEELRRIAASIRRNEVHSTLNATALVHEAWLRLKDCPQVAETTPLHFKRIVARVIRQVLIEAARERNALKRGGADAQRITLDESLSASADSIVELIQIDEALDLLEAVDARQAKLAELKIFSDLTNPEIAVELGISLATMERDWRAAKAWLKVHIRAK